MYGFTVKTLLSLEEFVEQIQFMPWWFAQIGAGFPTTWNYGCSDVTFQKAWQSNDALSREEVAQAVATAEGLIADALGFPVAPQYFEGETVQYPTPIQFSQLNTMWTMNGDYKPVTTNWKHIQSVGVQYQTLVEAASAVTYTDEDSDAVEDTFEVTATVPAGTVASEIKLFFTDTDRLGKDQVYYEIRPISVTISGVTATIKGSKWLVVKPVKYLGIHPVSLDQSDSANFITEVDVYRQQVDLSQAGSLIWNNRPWFPCNQPPCSVQINVGCFENGNSELGEILPQPAQWDADTSSWAYECLRRNDAPDKVAVNYVAGYPRQADGRMHAPFARAVTALAASLLEKRKCGCSRANKILDTWQSYPGEGEVSSEKRRLILTAERINSGWSKNGAVEAWNIIKDYIIWGAVKP